MTVWVGCGAGDGVGVPGGMDGGPDTDVDAGDGVADSGGGGMDAGVPPSEDSGPEQLDSGPVEPDAGPPPGERSTCEACEVDSDCVARSYCVTLAGGGRACLPACDTDLPECPARFDCVSDFSASVPEAVCAPVGEPCCVDADADGHGQGVGCLGLDCDEAEPAVNASAPDVCNALDDDCSGAPDDSAPEVLCPPGPNVDATRCTDGACHIDACALGHGDCDGDPSNGCEQPLDTTEHCGSCGAVCDLPGASESCAGGTCEVTDCDPGLGDCDGDPSNGCERPLDTGADCGACGTACAPANGTGDCSTGSCTVSGCAAGYDDCDSDPANGCEASLSTDIDCGSCGAPCTLANASASCASGTCEVSGCDPGFGDCDGVASNGCEQPLDDTAHCGACANACSAPGGTAACVDEACAVGSCDPGFGDCDGDPTNGCEQALATDAHCGACDVACAPASGTGDCSTGTCTVAGCAAGYDDCDGDPANGCEVSLSTDTDCGSCGTPCALANASESCASGTCEVTGCDPGYGDCDGVASNGCEQPLTTGAHCGTCGNRCELANASESCGTGSCQLTGCEPGYGNCDGVSANGCERALDTNGDCGGCGVTCAPANGSGSCGSGTCTVSSCNSGFADCDGSAANGCETSTRSDASCGGCGIVCSLPNASSSCSTGTCRVTSCSPGYGNCNGIDSDGCETRLDSLSHCGSCGTPCGHSNGSSSCAGGTCRLTGCSGGYGNCDGIEANGCETSTTNNTHCGACFTSCNPNNGFGNCSSGTCQVAGCNSGYGNCDGASSNGCEQQLNTTTHCSACWSSCSLANASETCSSGSCQLTGCDSNYGNCNGISSDGCETDLRTNSNCGSCGSTCSLPSANESCSTGTCRITSCTGDDANCDGNDANGCEYDLDPGSNCSSQTLTHMGSVSGDTGGFNGWELVRTGLREQVFRVWVTEDDSSGAAENLMVSVHLENNTGNDYSLHLGMDDCGESGCWRRRNDTGAGGNEYHSIEWPDQQPANSSRYVYIWVQRVSGNSCGSYTVRVDGDTLYSGRHWVCSS